MFTYRSAISGSRAARSGRTRIAPRRAAAVLVVMNVEHAVAKLAVMGPEQAVATLEVMDPGQAAVILKAMKIG